MYKIDPIIVHLSSHLQGEAGEIITGLFLSAAECERK